MRTKAIWGWGKSFQFIKLSDNSTCQVLSLHFIYLSDHHLVSYSNRLFCQSMQMSFILETSINCYCAQTWISLNFTFGGGCGGSVKKIKSKFCVLLVALNGFGIFPFLYLDFHVGLSSPPLFQSNKKNTAMNNRSQFPLPFDSHPFLLEHFLSTHCLLCLSLLTMCQLEIAMFI